AEDREVLREHVDLAAVDVAVAGDHAVAGDLGLAHPEVEAAMRAQLVELDERAGIEEQLDPLARGELALAVLLFDALGTAARFRALVQSAERGDVVRGAAVHAREASLETAHCTTTTSALVRERSGADVVTLGRAPRFVLDRPDP